MKTVYDFTVKDMQGNDVALSTYAGKVLLIVNTATGCGFTPQYEPLEAMYADLKAHAEIRHGLPAVRKSRCQRRKRGPAVRLPRGRKAVHGLRQGAEERRAEQVRRHEQQEVRRQDLHRLELHQVSG